MVADILIVDDNETFLLSLVEGLKIHDEELTVRTAFNGKEAVKILTTTSIDLVISDLKMPVMDGFELLAYMSRDFPQIPMIIITAFGTPEIERNIQNKGAYIYLEKPLEFNMIVSKIYEGLEAKSGGYITEIFLPSFLQLVEMEKKTCLLVVHSQGRTGNLFFQEGELVHAETEGMVAMDAALKIIGWENGTIEIKNKFKKPVKTIQTDLSYILIESLRQKDETNKNLYEFLPGEMEQMEIDPQGPPDDPETNPLIGEKQINKEAIMSINVKRLQEAVEALKDNIGAGLIACDIWSSHDGQSLVGYNPQPKACALFNQITIYLSRSLKESGFPSLGRLYTVELIDNKLIVVMNVGNYQLGMLADTTKVSLGLLLNVAVPNALISLEEALKS